MMTLAVLRALGWPLEKAKEHIQSRRYVVDFADIYVESVENFISTYENRRLESGDPVIHGKPGQVG
jgi:hypothetical protein